jgi:hypothetical protein
LRINEGKMWEQLMFYELVSGALVAPVITPVKSIKK